jgi:hypothetical protein
VIVENKVSVPINNESPGVNLRASGSNTINFREKNARIEHNSCPQETLHMGAKDTTRKKAQRGLYSTYNDRMPSVVSSLEANYPIGPFGQYVDYLALSFVTPLGAYDYDA